MQTYFANKVEVVMMSVTEASESEKPKSAMPDFGLTQRGRASVEVLGAIQKCSSGALRSKAAENFEAHPIGARLIAEEISDSSPTAMRARVAQSKAVANADPVFRLERFMQRYVAEEIFTRGIVGVEERRAAFEAFMTPGPETAGGSLELDPDIENPAYYAKTQWHLEPGGWDGYDLYGPVLANVIAPAVFRHGGYAAVPPGADITKHRAEMLRLLPKPNYARIYEPGCGGGAIAAAASQVFPEAEVVGSDLSPLLLKNGHTMAERRGMKVTLKQRDLLDTREPDNSFGAVAMFALNHELPPKVNVALFKEMYRILEPGGDLVMGDPPPFREVDPFHAVILDWDTENREEPFFTATLLSNWDEELTRLGFVDVRSFALGPKAYPWVTLARKPG